MADFSLASSQFESPIWSGQLQQIACTGVIPYNSELVEKGGLVAPDGSVILGNGVFGDLERLARNIVCGPYYKVLSMDHRELSLEERSLISQFREKYNYRGSIRDVDPWISSELTQEQLKQFMSYCNSVGSAWISYTYFLVSFLGYSAYDNFSDVYRAVPENYPQRLIVTANPCGFQRFQQFFERGTMIHKIWICSIDPDNNGILYCDDPNFNMLNDTDDDWAAARDLVAFQKICNTQFIVYPPSHAFIEGYKLSR